MHRVDLFRRRAPWWLGAALVILPSLGNGADQQDTVSKKEPAAKGSAAAQEPDKKDSEKKDSEKKDSEKKGAVAAAASPGPRGSEAPKTGTDREPKTSPHPKPAWQVCASGRKFTCETVEQGVAASPQHPPPRVCGCPPTCPPQHRPRATLSDKTWPDGSSRASYSCEGPNAGRPPSAARPR